MARLTSAITARPCRALAYQKARVLWLAAHQHVNQCKELLELAVANTYSGQSRRLVAALLHTEAYFTGSSDWASSPKAAERR